MNLRLWQRLFLTFAALASIALVGFVIWQQQAFRKGFLAYLDQAALERLQPVSDRLAEAYDENGNWDFLRNDTRQFGELILPERHRAQRQSKRIERLREALPPEAAADVAQRHPPPAWRENEREREGRRRVLEGSLLSRLLLVDAQGAPVVGDPAIARGSASVPIMLDGERIGSLLLAALPRIRSAADLAFALARWLLTPVRELAAGTRALAAGDYTRRMGNRRRDELGALAADFNHLAHTLEQHREARRRWGADIAHELRTPLSILRGEIQALQDGVRTATPAALNSLHAECERMGGLIEDLYQLSLADAGALEYHFEPLDMGEVLAEALETQLPSLEESGLAVATAIASVPPIRGDARRLGQLIDNLLMNTRRYTDAPGRLRIELSAVAGEVILVLEDSAPGVPSDSLELLFDRLYRVDASRNRAAGGTGLGLAICLAIVTAHGGHIAASASALGGLRIEVRLPAIGAGA